MDEAISGSATNVNSLAYSADFGDGMTWKNDLFQVGPWSSQQKSLAMNTSDLGGGVGVIGIANAATTPASTPSGGGVLFVESGALKFKGSSGTVTTIAPA